MSNNYKTKSAEVISSLEREGYSARTLDDHRRCFAALGEHLSLKHEAFSMEIALEWLKSRKSSWSYDTYKRYRRALYRFEKYLKHGEIERDLHCSNNHFAYRDTGVSYINLPENYKMLYCEFYTAISNTHAKQTIDHYVVGSTDFLLFLAEKGCASLAEMTIELPAEYLRRIRGKNCSDDKKSKYAESVGTLLSYLSVGNHIPRCYSHVLSKLDSEQYIATLRMSEKPLNPAFQPSKALEAQVDVFLSDISKRRYSIPPEQAHGSVFRSFFIFLELNQMPYSREATHIWLEHIPKTANWEQKRMIITWFANFMETGHTEKRLNFAFKPPLIETLPKWSRKIVEDYLTLRKKEGCEASTIAMARSSCVRFFRFIDSQGINNPTGITPIIVKEFHNTDPHTTPQGRNAYGARVRRLLKYMAEENLVPPNLYLAISAQCAPKREIVTIMSEDMIAAVYNYRKNAATSQELRNAAMVMLGLRMGLRSSDVVNLKIDNFDWKSRKVSFVQVKTKKFIELSIPTDVGNTVYKYITQGRPQSGLSGAGFIFIRHNSPYSNLNRRNCINALARILSASGLKLPPGAGFHITRRTFATRLLNARAKVDSIADALGHASRQSVDDYLLHDEEGMMLCPLSFGIGGALDEIYV